MERKIIRMDFYVRSYVQINESIQIMIDPLNYPLEVSNFSWSFCVPYQQTGAVVTTVHSSVPFEGEPLEYISGNVVVGILKLIESNAHLKDILQLKAVPQLSQEEQLISNFVKELNEIIKKLKEEQTIYVNVLDLSARQPLYPQFSIDPRTQAKLTMINALMYSIGNPPNDTPVDQTINYRYLSPTIVNWLIEGGIPASRSFAPFVANWLELFGGQQYLMSQKNTQLFYDHLIHWFHVEMQLVVNQQYYEKLGFADLQIPLTAMAEIFPELDIVDFVGEKLVDNITSPMVKEIYVRNFIDFHIIMVRAQWDKLILLASYELEEKPRDKINQTIANLMKKLDGLSQLPPLSKYYFQVFLWLGQERLKSREEGGWLRHFRDGLVHKTGSHSSGIVPQKHSLLSANEIWHKAKEEHQFLREAFMVLMTALLLAGRTPRE